MTAVVRAYLHLVATGMAAIILGLVVLAHDNSEDLDLLASIGVLGGIAILITVVLLAVRDHDD